MSRFMLLVPDAKGSAELDHTWYPRYLKRVRTMNEAQLMPPPDETASTASSWVRSNIHMLREDYTGKDSVLVGHGLGGVAVLRFLEKQKSSQQVGRVLLVSTPIGIPPIRDMERIEAFAGGFEFDWQAIQAAAGHFTVYHAFDDPVVGVENGPTLAENLGMPAAIVRRSGGHFNTPPASAALSAMLPGFGA